MKDPQTPASIVSKHFGDSSIEAKSNGQNDTRVENFLGSPIGVLVAMVLAVLLFTGIAFVARSTAIEVDKTWGLRSYYILACVVLILLLRWNVVYAMVYPASSKMAIWNAVAFTLAVSLTSMLFEPSFLYKVPLFYGAALAWVVWCWCYCQMTDPRFGLTNADNIEQVVALGQAGKVYFKVMDFLLSGYAMLLVFFYFGMIPIFGYTKAPLASLEDYHWILDIRAILGIVIVAVSLIRAAIVALSEGVRIKELLPNRFSPNVWYSPVVEVFRLVINSVASTVETMIFYIMSIGSAWLKSVGQHALRLRNALITLCVLALFILGSSMAFQMATEIWLYQPIVSPLSAVLPFLWIIFFFVIMILIAVLINFLTHCKVERWFALIDAQEWTTFSSKRSLAAPAFVVFALWFAALLLVGLSYFKLAGLPLFRHAGPFVFTVLLVMVLGGLIMTLRSRKASRTNGADPN